MIQVQHPAWMSRTELLLGAEALTALTGRHVLVVGLGGVGGICAEMIARSGVGEMTLIDADIVDISNTNRQIVSLHSSVGQRKADVLAARLSDINPALKLNLIHHFIDEENVEALFDQHRFDAVADCIDTLSPKVALLEQCLKRQIPVVSSMGAGGKVDPGQINISDISKTTECTLAKYVRKRLRARGIRKGFKAVYSTEIIDPERVVVTLNALPKKSIIGTISYLPALFGCNVAGTLIQQLLSLPERKGANGN